MVEEQPAEIHYEQIDEAWQVSIDPDARSEVSVASIARTRSPTPSLSSDSASNGGVADEASVTKFISWTTSFVNVNLTDMAPREEGHSVPISVASRCRKMPFFQYRIAILATLLAITIAYPGLLIGVLWGLYISFVGFLYFFVSDPLPPRERKTIPDEIMKDISDDLSSSHLNGSVLYKGWMNELRGRYSSVTYHVNQTQTVLVRLDRHMLRISRPERAVLKHAFHTDPTLAESRPKLVGQSIYDLTDAKVSLRPKRLAKRRWWSRKYPIYIRLASHRSITTADGRGVPDVSGGAASAADIQNIREGDEGYDPEESSDDESSAAPIHLPRANSTGDMKAFAASRVDRNAHYSSPCRLYLFTRSAREKERWFHRLREACSQYRTRPSTDDNYKSKASTSSTSRKFDRLSRRKAELERTFSVPNDLTTLVDTGSEIPMNLESLQYMSNHFQFLRYLTDVLGTECSEKSRETGTVLMDLGHNKWVPPKKEDARSEIVVAVNLLATRIFFDFCRDDYWCKAVRDKIQTKLATIHLPYFIETLELSSLDLGTEAPQIIAVYAPIADQWGIWTDFEVCIKYDGGIRLVLETRVNLMKLKQQRSRPVEVKKACRLTNGSHSNCYSDESIPESPESSPDEDYGSKTNHDKARTTKEKTGKRLLNFVDRVAQSKVFQEAAELKSVKKLMEGISGTRLVLNVEVTALAGPMTVNIPPPPSDRLWYAFRTPPRISIRAVPQVGDRSVDFSAVSDWIESKLRVLLEKSLVCPNMDDIIIPVMSGNGLLNTGYNK